MIAYNKKNRPVDIGLKQDILYFQFPSLSGQDLLFHKVFTRNGGQSTPPYESLNVSYDTQDIPENVSSNLEIIKESIGASRLIYMHQTHGKEIAILKDPHVPEIESIQDSDAIITNIPDIAIMVKQADCQGVILYDPLMRVVSVTHCGWRGSCLNILGSVVKKMISEFGCMASDIIACIGPSLGPCCGEFITHRRIFPKEFRQFMVKRNFFNLWELSRKQLIEAGLRGEGIEIAGLCTKCNSDLFFSYRAEGITGRFGTVAMMR